MRRRGHAGRWSFVVDTRSPGALALCASAVLAVACGGGGADVSFAPDDDGPPDFRDDDPPESPTGQRLVDVLVDDACGRTRALTVLADEICGIDATPPAPAALHAAMLRDGVVVDDVVYAVDAAHLWAGDLAAPGAGLAHVVGGIGRPVALARAPSGALLVASADYGLVSVDVSDPGAPQVGAPLLLPGLALDVTVLDDGRGVVALGDAGVAIVDATGPLTVLAVHPVPGLTAAVAVADGRIYVAGCTGLFILDLESGALLGEAWLDTAVKDGFLVAPAKDVTVAGDTVAVAAGRFGAVVVDVSEPSTPVIRGFCTRHADLSFYASGVKLDGDRLFIAGGEWGVLEVDASTCTSLTSPSMAPLPEADTASCETEPPWEVLAQEQWVPAFWRGLFAWAPTIPWGAPEAGRDPIQVLVDDHGLLAFGDARRVGIRSVDVYALDAELLEKTARVEEPVALMGARASEGTILFGGPRGGQFVVEEDLGLTRLAVTPSPDALPVGTVMGAPLFVSSDGTIHGGPTMTTVGPVSARESMIVDGNGLVRAATPSALVTIDVVEGTTSETALPAAAALAPALVVDDDGGIVVAAPEWTAAAVVDGAPLADHGAFAADEIEDLALWWRGPPQRLLAHADGALLELAGFAGRTRLVRHGAAPASVDVPPLRYLALVPSSTTPSHATLVAADRARLTSQLVTVDLDAAPPRVVAIESFAGVAVGGVSDPRALVVPLLDGTVRLYADDEGVPALVTTRVIEAAP